MLLFDQNISSRILRELKSEFPGSLHVVEIGMEDASDLEIFEFAKINDLAIVTFDSDFADLGTVRGFPPKIIWLRTGNHTTKDLVRVMVLNVVSITNFLSSSEGGVLEIQRNHF